MVSLLSIIYLAAALLVALFGANALLLATLHLRRGKTYPVQAPEPETWPVGGLLPGCSIASTHGISGLLIGLRPGCHICQTL